MTDEATTGAEDLSDVPTLSIDDILSSDDIQFRNIDMRPLGWKGKARVGSLSAEEIVQWQEASENASARKRAGIRLIVRSLVDDKGNRIGRDEHFNKLAAKSHLAIQKIVEEVLDMNGLVVKKKEAIPTERAKND